MVDTNISLETVPVKVENAFVEIISDPEKGIKEAVVVLPERGEVKVLNEVGGMIWELIDGIKTVREIAGVVTEKYDVPEEQIEADTLAFIGVLVEKKMIHFRESRKG